ncbi:unnamed protein product [Blumeria hordei]|uniref:Uncharacterized protein n=1 Tax=Blumeria hordei TaxID=2867405 RepID=A0A383V085_BLUHO|nr:unnamed protein product [Blumeria hordei]
MLPGENFTNIPTFEQPKIILKIIVCAFPLPKNMKER